MEFIHGNIVIISLVSGFQVNNYEIQWEANW